MNTLLETASSDLAGIFLSGEVGESATHVAEDGTTTGILAQFSPVAVDDLGGGWVADTAQVVFPRSFLRQCRRGQHLLRYPGEAPVFVLQSGWRLLSEDGDGILLESSGAEEQWAIEDVQDFGASWVLRCLRQLRPVPRGG